MQTYLRQSTLYSSTTPIHLSLILNTRCGTLLHKTWLHEFVLQQLREPLRHNDKCKLEDVLSLIDTVGSYLNQ